MFFYTRDAVTVLPQKKTNAGAERSPIRNFCIAATPTEHHCSSHTDVTCSFVDRQSTLPRHIRRFPVSDSTLHADRSLTRRFCIATTSTESHYSSRNNIASFSSNRERQLPLQGTADRKQRHGTVRHRTHPNLFHSFVLNCQHEYFQQNRDLTGNCPLCDAAQALPWQRAAEANLRLLCIARVKSASRCRRDYTNRAPSSLVQNLDQFQKNRAEQRVPQICPSMTA